MGAELAIYEENIIFRENNKRLIVLLEVARIYNMELIEKLQKKGSQNWIISDENGSIFELLDEDISKYKQDILNLDNTARIDIPAEDEEEKIFRCELSY